MPPALCHPSAVSPGSGVAPVGGVDTGGAAGASPVCAGTAALTGDSQGFSDLSLPPQPVFCSLALSHPALL